MLRIFLFFVFFTLFSCDSKKDFNIFSDNEKSEEQYKNKNIQDPVKKKTNVEAKINSNQRNTRSERTDELQLSDISVIGQARKDKSEIISFFFDLFDDDADKSVKSEKKNDLKKIDKKLSLEPLPKISTTEISKKNKSKIEQKNNFKEDKINTIETLNNDLKKTKELGLNIDENNNLNKEEYTFKDTKKEILKTTKSVREKKTFNIVENEELAFYKKKIETKKRKVPESNFIKVGMLLPLTGEKKAAGDLVMNSLRYSMSTRPNNLIFKIYDTKGQPSDAVKAAKEGINEGIKLFIGPIFSDETKEINSFFSGEDVKFFSLSPDFSNVSDNVIVSGENPDDQIACIRQNLLENNLKRVLLIFPKNKYGQVIKNGFRKFHNDHKHQIKFEYFELSSAMDLNNEIKNLSRYESRRIRLDEEITRVKKDRSMNKKEKDFQLKNLERQLTLDVPYDAVIVASQGDRLVEVLSHLAFYDINTQNTFIYGTSLWEDTNRFDKVFEGSFYVTSLKEKPESFKKDFKEIFSKDPLSFNFYIYDLIDLVNQYQDFGETNKIFSGKFSNSKINSGLLRRETYLKKVLKNNEVANISSCSLGEL